jgi:DUF1009 family protein
MNRPARSSQPAFVHSPEVGKPFGLIAGNGQFPVMLCKKLKAQGRPVFVVAHRGESEKVLEELASEIIWIYTGQIGRAIRFFRKAGVEELCCLGGIRRSGLFHSLRPDFVGLKILLQLPHRGDDRVLRGLLQYLEHTGFTVRSASELLPECIPQEGIFAGKMLTVAEEKDARIGWDCLELLSDLDIGQTLVVHDECIIAVEAAEGTDATILRAGTLSAPGSVVVKRAKRGQDRRIDLPAIGPNTIESLVHAKARALVLESESCLILNPEEVRRNAERAGISIIVYPRSPGAKQ